MRRTALMVTVAVGLAACTDLRDFRGPWHGSRAGDAPALVVGGTPTATATLMVDQLDPHGLHGVLDVDGLVARADVSSLAGAEADALSGLTFTGSPLRVYVAFVDTSDGGGQALALVALYEDPRIEVRLLRGGLAPLYAIFPLAEGPLAEGPLAEGPLAESASP